MKIVFSHYWIGKRNGLNTIMFRKFAGLVKAVPELEFTLEYL